MEKLIIRVRQKARVEEHVGGVWVLRSLGGIRILCEWGRVIIHRPRIPGQGRGPALACIPHTKRRRKGHLLLIHTSWANGGSVEHG